MAGAVSLEKDILDLVEKHSDSCLAEDLLRRLAEEARLLAAREEIRSLHEADRFGLFTALDDQVKHDAGERNGNAAQFRGEPTTGAAALPDNVKAMLSMMKVKRLEKVSALNGFTSIDAEVEFSRCGDDTGGLPRKEAALGNGKGQDQTKEQQQQQGGHNRPPVFLTFRFRREPLFPRVTESCCRSTAQAIYASQGAEETGAQTDAAKENGGAVASVDDTSTLPRVENHRDGHANAEEGTHPDGRKRAGSDSAEGANGKARKRRKGDTDSEDVRPRRGSEGSVMDEGKVDKVAQASASAETDVTGSDKDSDSDGEGLDYDPKTLVSYTITGAIGYERPEILLQAVVYARGDGPACVVPPPEDEEDPDTAIQDQEDVFDCNVDGQALAAIGQALGLHTEPLASEAAPVPADAKKDKDRGGSKGVMTSSDLVWWVMLFPFFEKEFDMVEVVASSVFGEEDSDSDDGEGESEKDDGGPDSGSASDGGR